MRYLHIPWAVIEPAFYLLQVVYEQRSASTESGMQIAALWVLFYT